MERSPIKDVEIKVLLKAALTDEINSREVYLNGIDQSYYYEGCTIFKADAFRNLFNLYRCRFCMQPQTG